ncbi:trypsin-like peptidase domain-containing protein [Akkermansiaceae bacterium]|nr:trypsin-like peptidase domain-containing protein [Akkermansiaceae bacterium]
MNLRTIPALVLLTAVAGAAPVVIDDAALIRALQKGVSDFAESGEGITADQLAKDVAAAPAKLDLAIPAVSPPENLDASVYLIGSVYKCGKCDKWHSSGTATAWALAEDGLMVSNHHVFANTKGGAMGVCGIDGKVHRVMEILAADEANDIAIFRVDASGLQPLGIGEPAPVGTAVQVIGNPDQRLFTHTFGHVSRYHNRPKAPGGAGILQMSITADYAKGSSGGPVLNAAGEVIGMVSSTQSIYYKGKEQGPLQMVVKNCVPASSISAMIPQYGGKTAQVPEGAPQEQPQ